jgi:U3 small nucleolar RNA-associated protein 20
VSMLALQVFGFYFDASERALKNEKDLRLVLNHAAGLLNSGTSDEADEETINAAIDTIRTLSQKFPAVLSLPDHRELWARIRQYMVHNHNSVRLNAVRLMASYLVNFTGESRTTDEGTVLLGRHGGELLSTDIEDMVGLLIRILSTPVVSEELATEAGQVVIFLAPHLPATVKEVDGLELETAEVDGADEAEADADEEEEEEKEGAEEEGEAGASTPRRKDLHFLFWKLSSILRKQRAPKAEAINTKVTAMEVLETLCRRLPPDSFRDSIKTILVPLHHLTDRTIPTPSSHDAVFNTKYENLKVRAQILMDALQKQLGTTEYSRYLLEIREAVRQRRQERSAKRKIEAVTQPEKFGRDKRRKFERKKERRKVQGQEHKAARQNFKRW